VPAQPYQRALLVPVAGDRTYDTVRDSVAALGLPLSRLELRRHQVEEIFREDDQPGQSSPGQPSQLAAADVY
jgi:ABC-2 type transport system ATP-binding protein